MPKRNPLPDGHVARLLLKHPEAVVEPVPIRIDGTPGRPRDGCLRVSETHGFAEAKRRASTECALCRGEGAVCLTFPLGAKRPISGLTLGAGGSLRIWCDCSSQQYATEYEEARGA